MSDATNGAAPAATDAKPSLDDTLSATYDRIMARDGAAGDNPADTPATAPAEAGPGKPAASDERPRGPDGKFVAKDAVASDPPPEKVETPTVADAKAAAPADADHKSATEEPAPDKVPIPKTWQNEARRALFIKSPPEVQRALADREAEMENGVAKLQQRYAGIEQLVAPIRQQLAVEGRSPEQYIGALMAADNMLRTNPHHAIGQIARMYGIDIGAAAQRGQPAQDHGNPLAAEIMSLRQQIDELKAQPTKMAISEATQQIEDFGADPSNAYFPQVRSLMASIISNGSATTLKDAYEIAVHAHPEVRRLIDATKAAQAQAAQADAAKKAAVEAQRASAMNAATRSGVGATPAAKGTWQETMERTAARLLAS